MAHIQTRILGDGKTKSYDVTWQVEVDGKRKNPQQSFRRRRDAEDFRRQIAADELEGIITRKPQKRSELFQGLTENWLKTRPVRGNPLAPATLIGYGGLLRRNIYPHFAHTQIRRITAEDVRFWYAEVTATAGADQARKSYRLLHAILATAAEEGVIPNRVNPCQIKGAGVEPPVERPLVETSVVLELAEAIDDRYRALVYLAGFGGLRTGESLALRRREIFPAKRTLRVINQAQELKGLGRHVSGPKSEAGKRTVTLPKMAMIALEQHMERFTGPEPDAIVFTAVRGGPVRRARLSTAWTAAKTKVGVDPELQLHPHDLRHHGLTLAARKPGVTTKELMARGGHSSPRAALRYQHAAAERDQEVADFMDDQIASAERPRHAEIVTLRNGWKDFGRI